MAKVVDSQLNDKCGAGCITLEALLDSPGLTHQPLPEIVTGFPKNIISVSKINSLDSSTASLIQNNIHNMLISKLSQDLVEKQTLLKDVCMELVCVLKDQDVNGYFTFPLSLSNINLKSFEKNLGLLDIEKKINLKKYRNLSEFRHDINHLFTKAIDYYQYDLIGNQEAHRMYGIVQDWFNSLPMEYFMTNVDLPHSKSNPIQSIDERETHLQILNPDNHGIVNKLERIQSIGQEVGSLHSGSYLIPCGGYREDRRNKIIPYTYLDYGPYYSFGPVYDSSAAQCTPESNQLLLGTTWLPGRTPYILGEHMQNSCKNDGNVDDNIGFLSDNEIASLLQTTGDQKLVQSLIMAQIDDKMNEQVCKELEQILPDPNTSDDCVFSLCLASIFTKNLLSKDMGTNVANKDRTDQNNNLQTNRENQEQSYKSGTESIDNAMKITSTNGNEQTTCDLDSNGLYESKSESKDTKKICENSQLLNESAQDLRALYCAQYLRLGNTSSQTPNHVDGSSTLTPSLNEMKLAHSLTRRLVNLTKRVRPRDVVHPYAIRKAIGLKPDDYALPDEIEDEAQTNGHCDDDDVDVDVAASAAADDDDPRVEDSNLLIDIDAQ